MVLSLNYNLICDSLKNTKITYQINFLRFDFQIPASYNKRLACAKCKLNGYWPEWCLLPNQRKDNSSGLIYNTDDGLLSKEFILDFAMAHLPRIPKNFSSDLDESKKLPKLVSKPRNSTFLWKYLMPANSSNMC